MWSCNRGIRSARFWLVRGEGVSIIGCVVCRVRVFAMMLGNDVWRILAWVGLDGFVGEGASAKTRAGGGKGVGKSRYLSYF